MITAVNVLRIIIWLLIVPCFIGRLFDRQFDGGEGIRISSCYAFGFAAMCAVFQLLAVPMIIAKLPFHVLKYSWIIVILALFAVSFIINIRSVFEGIKSFKSPGFSDRFLIFIWLAAFFVIVFQIWLLGFHMHTDTDDARFLAEAVEAYEKDTMLMVHPITGEYLGKPYGEMLKDVTSPYPFFLALLGSLFGISPTIAAHFVMPFFLIPLCYLVYYMIGNLLFDGDKKDVGIFLLILSLIFFFSFGSIFASGYTLLTIIWQGRSVYLMIMLPLIWYMLLKMINEEKITPYDYIALVTAVIASALLSGMGVILSVLICFAYAGALFIQKKDIKASLGILLCTVPNVIYLLLTKMDIFG